MRAHSGLSCRKKTDLVIWQKMGMPRNLTTVVDFAIWNLFINRCFKKMKCKWH